MSDSLFSPLHLILLVLVAVILFGLPVLLVFVLAQWLDKRRQNLPDVRVAFVGVAIGGMTDVVSSSLLGILLILYVMARYDLFHAPNPAAALASAMHSNGWLYGLQLTIGISCSVLGGYVAAWIAKHDELLNGLLSSFLCIAIGIYSIFSGKDTQPMRIQILLLVASPAFAFLGGYLRQTRKRIDRTPKITSPSPEAS